MKKPTLVKEWRLLHRLWSSKLYFIGVALLTLGDAAQHILFTWGVLPHEFKASIPEDWVTVAAIFIFTASFLARYVRESKHHERAKHLRENAEDARDGGREA